MLAACAVSQTPQSTVTTTEATKSPKPSKPRGSWQTWTPAEREVAFAQWDSMFPTRPIKRGASVHPLPSRAPLAGFATGGASAAMLERAIVDQKIAGILVLHDGGIRLERYALGHSANGRWTSQSVAKSATSTLVGAAIKDGTIKSIDDPVTTYIAGLRGSAYEGVTIRQLLTMTSGVKWNEDYTDPTSDIGRFYSDPYDPALGRTVSYMRKLAREAPPGTKWVYKTGETHLLGELVALATGKTLSAYLSEKIWSAYGMEQDASWSIDPTGHELAGCCLQAWLRDYARLGQFILDGARIDGRSIVPDGFLEEATHKQAATNRPGRGYGYQWWTLEDGTFDAIGIHGQRIHIDSARRLVVAINSAWPVATGQAQSAAQLELLNAIAAAVDTEARGAEPPRTPQ